MVWLPIGPIAWEVKGAIMPKITCKGFRNGFPFVIQEHSDDGQPVEVWDGSTRCSGAPSKSSARNITVVGPGTAWPLKVKLDRLAELYWRYRRYQIDVTGLSIFRAGSPISFTGTREWFCQPNTDETADDPIEEQILTVPVNWHGNSMVSDPFIPTDYNGFSGVATVFFSVFVNFPQAFVDPDDDNYAWVSFGFSLNPSGLFLSSEKLLASNGFVVADGPLLNFNGEEIQTWIRHSSLVSVEVYGSIEMNVVEWRSFGGTWNSSTGAPL